MPYIPPYEKRSAKHCPDRGFKLQFNVWRQFYLERDERKDGFRTIEFINDCSVSWNCR